MNVIGIKKEQKRDDKKTKCGAWNTGLVPDIPVNELHGRRNLADHIEDVFEAMRCILPPNQSEVLRMRAIDEKTYEQIAKALGITESNARALYSRGIKAIQKHFGCTHVGRKRKGQKHLP